MDTKFEGIRDGSAWSTALLCVDQMPFAFALFSHVLMYLKTQIQVVISRAYFSNKLLTCKRF